MSLQPSNPSSDSSDGDSQIQTTFYYYAPYHVMICTQCQCIVLNSRLKQHLHDHHSALDPEAVEAVWDYFKTFPNRARSAKDLIIPTETISPVPHLPISCDTFQCQIDSCRWIGSQVNRMQEHHKRDHADHSHRPWIRVSSQQFTPRGPGSQRFAVHAVPATSSDSRGTPVPTEPVSKSWRSVSPARPIFGPSTSPRVQVLSDAVHDWCEGCPLCRAMNLPLAERAHPLHRCKQSNAQSVRKRGNQLHKFKQSSELCRDWPQWERLFADGPVQLNFCRQCLLPPALCGLYEAVPGGWDVCRGPDGMPSGNCLFPNLIIDTVNSISCAGGQILEIYILPTMEYDGCDVENIKATYQWFMTEREIEGVYVPNITHLFYRLWQLGVALRPSLA